VKVDKRASPFDDPVVQEQAVVILRRLYERWLAEQANQPPDAYASKPGPER
jgi:hypothetical protein